MLENILLMSNMQFSGVNTLREASKRVNERLDVENQIENPSFQSGRGTYITCSLKSKIPSAVIAKSTKHKDSTTVLKYAQADEELLEI